MIDDALKRSEKASRFRRFAFTGVVKVGGVRETESLAISRCALPEKTRNPMPADLPVDIFARKNKL